MSRVLCPSFSVSRAGGGADRLVVMVGGGMVFLKPGTAEAREQETPSVAGVSAGVCDRYSSVRTAPQKLTSYTLNTVTDSHRYGFTTVHATSKLTTRSCLVQYMEIINYKTIKNHRWHTATGCSERRVGRCVSTSNDHGAPWRPLPTLSLDCTAVVVHASGPLT